MTRPKERGNPGSGTAGTLERPTAGTTPSAAATPATGNGAANPAQKARPARRATPATAAQPNSLGTQTQILDTNLAECETLLFQIEAATRGGANRSAVPRPTATGQQTIDSLMGRCVTHSTTLLTTLREMASWVGEVSAPATAGTGG